MLTSISCCSGYRLSAFVGQVWTWSLWWIFSLHFLFLTFSRCPDRPRVTRWEGRTTNSNIFLGDWGELQLQWSGMSADWSSGSPLMPDKKEKEKKRMSHFVHFTVTVSCQWIFLVTHTFNLPFWWGGCSSALFNRGLFNITVDSSRSNIGAAVWGLLISIFLSCFFDLNQKEDTTKKQIEEKNPLFSFVVHINSDYRRVELPVSDWCFSACCC